MLGEDNYCSVIQQFLLAQCVSCALASNQIAHYINGPIESAVAHLGGVSRVKMAAVETTARNHFAVVISVLVPHLT